MRATVAAALTPLGALLFAAFSSAHSKNWDRDAATTEQGRIRSEYLSHAGTLPSYVYSEETKRSEPNGASYHMNCCGEGDAYEADEVFVDADGATWAVLTCNDPDNCKEVQGKIVRAPGSKFKVPAEKVLMNYDPVNDTGHGWVYLNPQMEGPDAFVYCWAAPPGS
jgi:hypothetical protein